MTMLIPIRDHNPYKRFPGVTIALIGINIWIFLRVGASNATVFRYGAVPCDVVGRCARLSQELHQQFPGRSALVTIVTSMFMHGGLAHIAGNMLYLWVFGNNVEDRLGHVRFVFFYFACGLAAAAAHIVISSGSTVPIVGASGAISGVLGAYIVLYPRARVLSLAFGFIPVEVTAGFLIGFWFVLQLLNALGTLSAQAPGGVAFIAHVGGFVTGWLLIKVLAPPVRPDPVDEWFR